MKTPNAFRLIVVAGIACGALITWSGCESAPAPPEGAADSRLSPEIARWVDEIERADEDLMSSDGHQKVVARLERAVAELERIPRAEPELADALERLALRKLLLGQPTTESEALLDRASELRQSSGANAPDKLMGNLMARASVATSGGETSEASRFLEQALEIAPDGSPARWQLLDRLALLHRKAKAPEVVMKYAQMAVDERKAAGEAGKERLLSAQVQLALTQEALEGSERADATFQEILAETAGDSSEAAAVHRVATLLWYAKFLARQPDPDRHEAIVREAVALSEPLGGYALVWSLGHLAALEEKKGNGDQAKALRERAEKLERKLPRPW